MTSKLSSSDAATTGPPEEEMKNVILSTLGSSTEVRPNKLRKVACKQVQGATWTQFTRCLEALIEEKAVQRKEKGGEVFLVLGSGNRGSSANSDKKRKNATTESDKPTDNTGEVEVLKEEIRISRVIALYLHKRKHIKLKNIETNTKTKLTIFGKLDGKQTDSSLDELHTLQIAAELSNENDETKKESEEAAKKHIEVAKHLIQKIVNAQKLNPARFAPKKSGGTFEEQEQTRLTMEKRRAHQKEDGRAHRKTKKEDRVTDEGAKKSQRKRAKFY
eukprot:CAMPEP_0119015878 /NCGR_PEP_ID=MMETSP1176-20130426/11702_1 /TAXON_ID=265551 /ORGANISM="Synedropsis recta cf, Strain CCMP1620" /LENGTH=274 /DNA_ID=CAMNT_0006969203 /DNA_START=17 /DNA_END=841 /DNA_ORIENTATION=+